MTDLSKLKIDRTSVPPTRRAGSRRVRWLIVALAIVAVAAYLGYSRFAGEIAVETGNVTTAYPYQSYTLLNATGYVVAQRKASVASKATGRLEWLGVVEGSRVKQGDVIARLENRDVAASEDQAAANLRAATANLAQGEAELNDAQRDLKRARELIEKRFISQAAYDQSLTRYRKAQAGLNSLRAGVAVAQAGLRSAQVGVDQTVIRAPFNGVVLTKHANVGDVVTPFSSALDTKGAVVTMADLSTLEVEADVSESNIAKINAGQPCEIQLDAFPEARFSGTVNRMVPTIDRAKATLLVKVRFNEPDSRVLPEMSAKVAFLDRAAGPDEHQPVTVTVPGAIVERNGRKVVYVVKDNHAVETAVTAGRRIGDLIEVRGVEAGARVVLNPPERLHDGAAVKQAKKA